MRVLLDTNVLAAGMMSQVRPSIRPPARIWRRWQDGQFDVMISAHLIEELQRAFQTPWFRDKATPDLLAAMLHELQTVAVFSEITVEVRGIASHWQDDLVLAAAVSGNADYLVSGDAEFRRVGEYRGVEIRTPAEFLSELESQAG